MSPTYTMSAHLCKQIYSSWRQTHPDPSHVSNTAASTPSYYPQRSPSPEKRSMDSDRSDSPPSPPLSRQNSSNWKWNRS